MKNMRKKFKCGLKMIKELFYIPFVPKKIVKIYLNKPGYLSLREAHLLYQNAKNLKGNKVVVEIGSYLGKSTCAIAEGIRGKNINFYTIDTFENQAMTEGRRNTFEEFLKNTSEYKDLITIKKGFSYDVVKKMQNVKIDFLWIDGDHTYQGVKRDIEDWVPLVKENGIVCFHDYKKLTGMSNKEVKKAVDEKIMGKWFKKEKQVDSIFMAKK